MTVASVVAAAFVSELALVAAGASPARAQEAPGGTAAPEATGAWPSPPLDPRHRYVFYLHPRVVEVYGPWGVSPEYGAYDYAGIIRALSDGGALVFSETRRSDTDPVIYADSVAVHLRRLLDAGVPAEHITVVGASKGGVIAMLVSTRMHEPGLGYVLIGNCNRTMYARFSPRLHGRVLSLFEASDSIGQSCTELFAASSELEARAEHRLTTGLRHGFLYRPLPEWVEPTQAWIWRKPP